MAIKLNRSLFKSGDPFFTAFANLTDQTWGGKPDAQLMKVAVVIQGELRDLNSQREKYVKEYGAPNDKGNFSMDGAPKESVKEFDKLMEDCFAIEFELPIEAPIKLIKRKKTHISPFQAAALSDIVEIIWPEDEGEELDKVEKM